MIVFLVLAAAVTLSGPVIGGPRRVAHTRSVAIGALALLWWLFTALLLPGPQGGYVLLTLPSWQAGPGVAFGGPLTLDELTGALTAGLRAYVVCVLFGIAWQTVPGHDWWRLARRVLGPFAGLVAPWCFLGDAAAAALPRRQAEAAQGWRTPCGRALAGTFALATATARAARTGALRDHSLTGQEGRITALVGPGGVGRSTEFDRLVDANPTHTLLVRPGADDARTVAQVLHTLRADADEFGLAAFRGRAVSALPPDLRARLALAELRHAPRVPLVLADQLMAAADPGCRRDLGTALRDRAGDGAHVLWAEHQLDAVWEFADEISEPGHPAVAAAEWSPATVREPTLLTLARIFDLPRARCRTAAGVRRLVAEPRLAKAVPSTRGPLGSPEVTMHPAEIGLTGHPLALLPGESVAVVHLSGRPEPVARRLAARLGAGRVPSVLPPELTPAEVARQWDRNHRATAAARLAEIPTLRLGAPLATHSSGEVAALRLLLARATPGPLWLPQPQLGLDQAAQLAAQRELQGGASGIRIVTTRDVEFLVRACRRVAIVDGEELLAFGSPSAVAHLLPERPLAARALVRAAPTRIGEIIESAAALTGGAA